MASVRRALLKRAALARQGRTVLAVPGNGSGHGLLESRNGRQLAGEGNRVWSGLAGHLRLHSLLRQSPCALTLCRALRNVVEMFTKEEVRVAGRSTGGYDLCRRPQAGRPSPSWSGQAKPVVEVGQAPRKRQAANGRGGVATARGGRGGRAAGRARRENRGRRTTANKTVANASAPISAL